MSTITHPGAPRATAAGSDPLSTVAELYRAFGDQDVARVLELLDDDVTFDADRSTPSLAEEAGHTLLTPHRGKDGVARFFAELGECRFHEFTVHQLLGNAETRTVAALITVDVSYPSGGRVHDDEVHVWTIGEHGLLTSLVHYVDTAKHLAGWRG